tara:strand:+ start:583 stop:813 length:231 start_codon:yes stop_codon:yes gene_type:complete
MLKTIKINAVEQIRNIKNACESCQGSNGFEYKIPKKEKDIQEDIDLNHGLNKKLIKHLTIAMEIEKEYINENKLCK